MFQFTGCPLPALCVQAGVLEDHSSGLPHSEIRGSKLDCSSPRRIAAYRVLHRPFAPRHPPRALCSLKSIRLFSRFCFPKELRKQRTLSTTLEHKSIPTSLDHSKKTGQNTLSCAQINTCLTALAYLSDHNFVWSFFITLKFYIMQLLKCEQPSLNWK